MVRPKVIINYLSR